MKREQAPIPGGDDEAPDTQDFFAPVKDHQVEGVEDILSDISAALDDAEKEKLAPLKCCGILPCKGRTPACYGCDLCMDCITGAGCGHDNSKHTPQSGNNLG